MAHLNCMVFEAPYISITGSGNYKTRQLQKNIVCCIETIWLWNILSFCFCFHNVTETAREYWMFEDLNLSPGVDSFPNPTYSNSTIFLWIYICICLFYCSRIHIHWRTYVHMHNWILLDKKWTRLVYHLFSSPVQRKTV